MSKEAIQLVFRKSAIQTDLMEALIQNLKPIEVRGLVGSSLSFVLADVFVQNRRSILLICKEREEAAYVLNDLESLLQDVDVLYYPSSYRRPYDVESTDNANILLRAEVLNRLHENKKPVIVVTYPEALFEKVVTRKEIESQHLKVREGDSLSLDFVNELLFEYRFHRVDFVSEPGEFAVRGGILDVFSYAHHEPYRIEFFGDEVDSIRTFDVESQLSLLRVKQIQLLPNLTDRQIVESRQSFLDYLPENAIMVVDQLSLLKSELDQLYQRAEKVFQSQPGEVKRTPPKELFSHGAEMIKTLLGRSLIHLGSDDLTVPAVTLDFRVLPQPAFNKQFDLLADHLKERQRQGYKNIILCANEQQVNRFKNILDEIAQAIPYEAMVSPLYQGFSWEEGKILCFTDHQIFERYHRFHLKSGYAKKQALTLKELNSLQKGDYVVHIDHGIGVFAGLQRIEVESKSQEAIKLLYGDRDILYVSIHSLHKITKYNGKDGTTPKIYKLGSKAWQQLKQKTKKRVKEIAFNLIEAYAKRRLRHGFKCRDDSYLQLELEASFLYEDTLDQAKATEDVKRDMESERPMDRLICGDVGFGKTEVAIRAAFKAVDNGKQVAVLVPTTILAFQHWRTFSERLKDMPVSVDYLNRFRTTKEKKEILTRLKDGKIDILIGTHLLVNQAEEFKDLGLLIVDEEQKFGVGVKEKLRDFKENIDVLTLTATPIPRTLQFSLMAARDLSIINTPPPNRYPIESTVIRFGEEVIRDAISYELQRGGQVFFIHNRIETIGEIAGMIQRLVPDARIGIGHGQMEGKKLETVMLGFMNGDFDVLVSTTIVENGLDVPNANTIFIHQAQNFGLSDLHQMRGRVGRRNKKAFAYFITPPYSVMTDEARKRIQALETFTDLGSGFHISMKDLEIRGAGDLLGGEQSGFINELGFETYQKILDEAIQELKENEFKELYDDNLSKHYVSEVQLDSDIPMLLPETYVNNISERLILYQQLASLKTEEELYTFEMNLRDRFGAPPEETLDLLHSVRLKWQAERLGLEKVVLKKDQLVGYFVSDQQSEYYQTDLFKGLLQKIQNPSLGIQIKEKETRQGLRLLLKIPEVDTVEEGLERLGALVPVG